MATTTLNTNKCTEQLRHYTLHEYTVSFPSDHTHTHTQIHFNQGLNTTTTKTKC